MSGTNRVAILLLGLVFALVIRKIRSGKGKTKYVLGSVGQREVNLNKKETKTGIEATNQLASVNREN